MKIHELTASTNKSRKRIGRGISAGQGKTAGRGTKGQNARTGKKLRPTFMGGQRALVQAVPKIRGFKSLKQPAQVVYLDTLNVFDGKTVDNYILFEEEFIATPFQSVKVVNRGELKAKLDLKTQGASKSAIEQIEKVGGKFTKTTVPLKKSQKEVEHSDK